MIIKVYALKDNVAGFYEMPMYFQNLGVAVREIGNILKDEKNRLVKNPKDFTLYEIGQYDSEAGIIAGREPLKVAEIEDLLQK